MSEAEFRGSSEAKAQFEAAQLKNLKQMVRAIVYHYKTIRFPHHLMYQDLPDPVRYQSGFTLETVLTSADDPVIAKLAEVFDGPSATSE